MAGIKKLYRGIHWRNIAVEFISIVAGVLIALAVDEWNEDRQNQNRATNAIENVSSELQENLKILNIIHPNNVAVMSALFDSTEGDANQNFLPGVQLQETAWQTMINTGVSAYIPYDDLYEIGAIYKMIEIYKRSGNQVMDSFTESRGLFLALDKTLADVEIFVANRAGLEVMMYLETSLLEELPKYLEKHPEGE